LRENFIGGAPVRVDFRNSSRSNVGAVEYENEAGEAKEEFFIINSSFGVLAEGNDLFNRGDKVIDWLKQRWVNGTIIYAALKTMLAYGRYRAELVIDGQERRLTSLTNLGIVINPHFTGSCRYDTDVSPRSPYMCLNLCENMGFFRQTRTFIKMGQGRFLGLPGTASWNIEKVEVIPERVVAFEMDGEVRRVTRVSVRLLGGEIRTCS
jgi:diacylglycerol kinase family enzyme